MVGKDTMGNPDGAGGPVPDPTWARLEDQIAWYDRKSGKAQRAYKRIKLVELVVATAIAPLAALDVDAPILSIVGSVVVLLEGTLHLFQYHDQWTTYRSTCEALKHERYLFLAKAGPYAAVPNAGALLAERVEGLVSQENAKWASTQQQPAAPQTAAGG